MQPEVTEFTDWNTVVPGGAVVNPDGSWIEWTDPAQPGKLCQVNLRGGVLRIIDGSHSGTITYDRIVGLESTETFGDYRKRLLAAGKTN